MGKRFWAAPLPNVWVRYLSPKALTASPIAIPPLESAAFVNFALAPSNPELLSLRSHLCLLLVRMRLHRHSLEGE